MAHPNYEWLSAACQRNSNGIQSWAFTGNSLSKARILDSCSTRTLEDPELYLLVQCLDAPEFVADYRNPPGTPGWVRREQFEGSSKEMAR